MTKLESMNPQTERANKNKETEWLSTKRKGIPIEAWKLNYLKEKYLSDLCYQFKKD
jgi:hypothetical protein